MNNEKSFVKKILYNMKYSLKETITIICSRSRKSEISNLNKKRYLVGLFSNIFCVLFVLGIIGEISSFFPSEIEQQSADILLDYKNWLNEECNSCNINEINVVGAELVTHKENEDTKLYCYVVNFPNSKINLDRDYTLCLLSEDDHTISSNYNKQYYQAVLGSTVVFYQELHNNSELRDSYNFKSLNDYAIQRLVNSN